MCNREMHDSACSLHIRAERDAWSAVQHRVSGCRNATSLGAAGGAVSRVVVCAMVEVGWRAPGKSSRILIRRAFARRATCCSLRFSASDGITASRRQLGEAPAKPHTVQKVAGYMCTCTKTTSRSFLQKVAHTRHPQHSRKGTASTGAAQKHGQGQHNNERRRRGARSHAALSRRTTSSSAHAPRPSSSNNPPLRP